ncbi:MAG: thiamine phosphate synthase [Planctomycetota bacterium]
MTERDKFSVIRILDAAANRASEGLRVVEDIARMHLDDPFLTESIKTSRHQLSSIVQNLLPTRFIVCRDTVGDVGTNIQTSSEYDRTSTYSSNNDTLNHWSSLAAANFKRVQQAIRTIEEIAKTEAVGELTPRDQIEALEQLRYQSYTLEKNILNCLNAQSVFSSPSIYVLIDGIDWSSHCDREQDTFDIQSTGKHSDSAWPTDWLSSRFAKTICSLVAANVDWIQLRDKSLSDRQLIVAARLIKHLASNSATRLVINDRVDIAVLVGADAVHVGQDELSVSEARRIAGQELLIGVSTHSVEQAERAVRDGADYIGIGPVFPSNTKSFRHHIGPDGVRNVIERSSLPAFAIGGIDVSNVEQLTQIGCHRIAVSGVFSSLIDEDQSRFIETANQLRELLQKE